ncbi:MAG: hypothetical protein QM757_17265 [Paludibaculum sp.]
MHQATPIVRSAARILTALTLCVWAANSTHSYSKLPPLHWARRCGNCFLGAVGVPIEAGIVRILLLWLSYAVPAPEERRLVLWTWVFLILGVVLTVFVIGLPIFLLCALQLAWIAAKATVLRATRRPI